jgi:hypothetical protein
MSWIVATGGNFDRRDRAIVTIAGICPDLDGVAIILSYFSSSPTHAHLWYSKYHHVLCHNLGFGLLVLVLSFLLATRRYRTPIIAFCAFHLHLLCDIAGSKGPDGYPWPIPYLLPFSDTWNLTWSGQWELTAWPNILITEILLVATILIARQKGVSPLDLIWPYGDGLLVKHLRGIFPKNRRSQQ